MNTTFTGQLERALFEATAGIDDPQTRIEFLSKACAGDQEMFDRITKWLHAQEAAEKFFVSASIARAEVSSTIIENPNSSTTQQSIHDALRQDASGIMIERYRLLEQIGEGGCGVVYLAEQSHPVVRKVALKIIRLGMDTESVIARFETERQSLALMDHPNIARVYDAGTTDNGRPFFVMEFIHGEKITQHCDTNRLGIRQRLELFIQVCNAIQHAHQKGIIHRDIKPSNVLVSTQNEDWTPKVIDFGIARVFEGAFSEDTRITNHMQLIGTPAYMSPEQAQGSHDVDTRGDIYSLGILLYELLTDRTPFDGQRLAKVGMLEMMRILREEEPLPPSTILEKLSPQEFSKVVENCNSDAKTLLAQIRGDLEIIVMKALEKAPENRYETVAEFASDIRSYLQDEPILARSQGQLYLLKKLVRRNKFAFLASLSIILSLSIGGIISGLFYIREREARQLAVSVQKREAFLLQQSRAREVIAQAAVLLAEGKASEADKILLNVPFSLLSPTPEALKVYRIYGEWNAIRSRWSQAAECYDFIIKGNGLNSCDIIEFRWLLMAASVIYVEDKKEENYRKLKNLCIQRIHNNLDLVTLSILMKSCLLNSKSIEYIDELRAVQSLIIKKIDERKRNNTFSLTANQWASIYTSLALFEYRKASFESSLQLCEMAHSNPCIEGSRITTIKSIQAMNFYKLGKLDSYQNMIYQADKLFTDGNNMGKPKSDLPWQYWAASHILLKEAQGMRTIN